MKINIFLFITISILFFFVTVSSAAVEVHVVKANDVINPIMVEYITKGIEKAEKAFRLIINSYDIDIDYNEVPSNIMVDSIIEAELYSILLNVLSNAIKSVIAAGGDKKIKITANREQGKTIIRVMDTGLGIDPAYYEEVFVPFIADPEGRLYKDLEKRLNPEDKYIVGTGSGLGLSIVKEIVQVRNGSISFRKPAGNWKTELEIILP